MGQYPSSFNYRHGRRRSFRSSFLRRSKLNSSSLSHTFSLPASEGYVELININTASEEQLMTLPGVTRQIAQAIVEHRQAIGRFKRTDDLALVSGIGADKLEAMRGEICTSRKILSSASSRTQSLDSLRSGCCGESSKLVNVNQASVFQLQCIPGLNQELAANVVDYRNKKGPFKSLDDLIKVRGIDLLRLSSVKTHLSLESMKPEEPDKCLPLNGQIKQERWPEQPLHTESNGINKMLPFPRTPGHKKSMSMPVKYPMALSNGFTSAPINDIFDLLSAYSHRPIIEEDFNYTRDNKGCCRIASWNLHKLCIEKAKNPGFREVVARTILENRVSLLCVQDVLNEEALKIVCDELNSPTLRRVREWKTNNRRWNYTFLGVNSNSRSLGFITDGSKAMPIENLTLERLQDLSVDDNITTLIAELENLPTISDSFKAVAAYFKINQKHIVIVNVSFGKLISVHDVKIFSYLTDLADSLNVSVTFIGDFYCMDNVNDLEPNLRSLLHEDINTCLDVALDFKGRSDFLVTIKSGCLYNGYSGVVRCGLTHLAIPHGWHWGGSASPHCPVWAEFLTD